jgi:hypothetical protein
MRARSIKPDSAEKTVRDIRRATRRHYSAEEKIRIVLEGLRGETSAFSTHGTKSNKGPSRSAADFTSPMQLEPNQMSPTLH